MYTHGPALTPTELLGSALWVIWGRGAELRDRTVMCICRCGFNVSLESGSGQWGVGWITLWSRPGSAEAFTSYLTLSWQIAAAFFCSVDTLFFHVLEINGICNVLNLHNVMHFRLKLYSAGNNEGLDLILSISRGVIHVRIIQIYTLYQTKRCKNGWMDAWILFQFPTSKCHV